MFETALKKGEIVESVEFQIPEKADYQKHPNPASRYAIIGVFVAKHKKDINVLKQLISHQKIRRNTE